MQEMWVQFLGREDPWRRKWQPTSVFLPGKSHGQRSLAGYSPWGHKSDGHDLMTKQQQKDSGQFICIFPPLSIKGLYVILMTRSVLHTTNSHCGKSTTPGFNSLMESTFFFTISNIIFHFQAELVSHDCQDKVPQTRWLKTTEIYSLIVLEARSTESRC